VSLLSGEFSGEDTVLVDVNENKEIVFRKSGDLAVKLEENINQ
jgi:hypothetical protein